MPAAPENVVERGPVPGVVGGQWGVWARGRVGVLSTPVPAGTPRQTGEAGPGVGRPPVLLGGSGRSRERPLGREPRAPGVQETRRLRGRGRGAALESGAEGGRRVSVGVSRTPRPGRPASPPLGPQVVVVPVPPPVTPPPPRDVGVGGDAVHIHGVSTTPEDGPPGLGFDVVIEPGLVTPPPLSLPGPTGVLRVVPVLLVSVPHNTDSGAVTRGDGRRGGPSRALLPRWERDGPRTPGRGTDGVRRECFSFAFFSFPFWGTSGGRRTAGDAPEQSGPRLTGRVETRTVRPVHECRDPTK